MQFLTLRMEQKTHNILTNQIFPCVMNDITLRTVEFITDRIHLYNYSIVDLTWFNQYSNKDLADLQGDLILLFDVADPVYYQARKIAWIKSLKKPSIFIGPPNNFIPCPKVPFHSWLRFRNQNIKHKQSRDNFFLSFVRKHSPHRVYLHDKLRHHERFLPTTHKIHSLSLDNDIVELQKLAQVIDEKQLHSSFEIVSETCPADDQVFLTEKIVKCIASETPLLLLGSRYSLKTLKNYYGFTDFGIDDSYDNLESIRLRTDIVLHQASSFFNYPLKTVFDNAKKNAYHLFNNFDNIHDRLVEKYLEKSMNHVKNSSSHGITFANRL